MASRRRAIAAVLMLAAAWCAVEAAAAQAGVRYTARRVGLFRQPIYLTAPKGDKRMFVVERAGRIVVVRGKRLRRRFLDISRDVYIKYPNSQGRDQRGLFTIAFAPDYARSGLLYLLYTAPNDTTRLEEVRRSASNPNRADPRTRRTVLEVGLAGAFHHGGGLQFGPDGYLYVGTGTTNRPEFGQDLSDLHGKILRIDPRASGDRPYSIPPDNPFVGRADARPEIWAYGLRNPWRFAFDPVSGGLAIGDVGESAAEEIDYLSKPQGGANFGYPIFEGGRRMLDAPTPADYVPPAIDHRHKRGFCGSVGGHWVRDRSLTGLYRRYVYADLCRPRLRSAILRRGRARDDRSIPLRVPYHVSFGEDSRGKLYAISLGGGVYRIDAVRRR